MKHGQAIEHLPEWASESLPNEIRHELEEHMSACVACREWIEAHELLATVLAAAPKSFHPADRLLARCATHPHEIFESDMEQVRAHLEECGSCKISTEQVQDAIEAARPAQSVDEGTRAARGGSTLARWLVAAAAILVVASLPTFLRYSEESEIPAYRSLTPTLLKSPGMQAEETEIFNTTIHGSRLIEGERLLMISQVEVDRGANVTFRAGKGIVFRDGFRVGPEARIAVEVTPSDQPTTDSNPR